MKVKLDDLQFGVRRVRAEGVAEASPDIRQQLKAKLSERLQHPHVPASPLQGLPVCYNIKLRASGFRLVYQVHVKLPVVTVIAVGKREKGLIYLAATKRI